MKKEKIKLLLKLFLTMLKIGAFTFGGGYAMIALLQREFAENKKWIKEDEFLDIIAIAESTPGPIAINSSTYIGYTLCGVAGSLVATLGVVLPSFVIIYVISLFFDKFLSLEFVASAFRGIQVCVVYLILSAGIKMFKKLKKDRLSIILLSLTVLCMITFSVLSVKFSSVFYILISGTVGLSAYLIARIKREDKK